MDDIQLISFKPTNELSSYDLKYRFDFNVHNSKHTLNTFLSKASRSMFLKKMKNSKPGFDLTSLPEEKQILLFIYSLAKSEMIKSGTSTSIIRFMVDKVKSIKNYLKWDISDEEFAVINKFWHHWDNKRADKRMYEMSEEKRADRKAAKKFARRPWGSSR